MSKALPAEHVEAFACTQRTMQAVVATATEVFRQIYLWGEQHHPDGTGVPGSADMAEWTKDETEKAFAAGEGTWAHILAEEFCEALAETDPETLAAELEQVAAVAMSWVRDIRARNLPVAA